LEDVSGVVHLVCVETSVKDPAAGKLFSARRRAVLVSVNYRYRICDDSNDMALSTSSWPSQPAVE
jgi:hypothetical protein